MSDGVAHQVNQHGAHFGGGLRIEGYSGAVDLQIDLLADQAEERGWSKLILNAPRQPEDGRKLYEQIAAPADWSSFVIRFDGR